MNANLFFEIHSVELDSLLTFNGMTFFFVDASNDITLISYEKVFKFEETID